MVDIFQDIIKANKQRSQLITIFIIIFQFIFIIDLEAIANEKNI